LVTGLIIKTSYKTVRVIVASILGGFSSLYIFFNTPIIYDVLFNLISGAALIVIAVGFVRFKVLALSYIVYLFLSFSLAGSVYFLQELFNETLLFSKNTVNYFNISPLFLITITAIIYITIRFIQRFKDRNNIEKYVTLHINVCGNTHKFNSLVDTGHDIKDPFGDADVFIIDKEKYKQIEESCINVESRKRVIPVSTVEGSSLLNALRIDNAKIISGDNCYTFSSVILAQSKSKLSEGIEAIVSYSSLLKIPDQRSNI
jgi:sigma-E processing peptidase SpoIIGA